jgi:hypothetical protein
VLEGRRPGIDRSGISLIAESNQATFDLATEQAA